jgi:HEAT repeat protein
MSSSWLEIIYVIAAIFTIYLGYETSGLFASFLIFIAGILFFFIFVREGKQGSRGYNILLKRAAHQREESRTNRQIRRLKHKQSYVRKAAVEALGSIETDQAADALKQALGNDDDLYVRSTAVEALGKIGTNKAVDALKPALMDKESYVSKAAVKALGKIGTDYAAGAIMEAWGNDDLYVRSTAVEALGKIGTNKAVDALKPALMDKESYVSNAAVKALGKIGTDTAVDMLKNALINPDWGARKQVAQELDSLNWEPSDDKEKAYYMIAKSEWGEIPKLGKPAVQPLIHALTYQPFFDRYQAAEALGKIRDSVAVEPLIKALEDRDKLLRSSAAESLGKIGDDRALDPLIDALRDNEAAVRRQAAGSLGKLALPKAIGPLKDRLKDLDSGVRRETAESLDELGWRPSNEEDEAYCLIAWQRWPQVERLGKPAVLPLIHTLKGFDERIEERAISSLANIGNAIGEPAISLMIEALRDEPSHVRSSISFALGRIGSQAVPLLLAATKDDHENVRIGARNALARVDPSQPP